MLVNATLQYAVHDVLEDELEPFLNEQGQDSWDVVTLESHWAFTREGVACFGYRVVLKRLVLPREAMLPPQILPAQPLTGPMWRR